VQVDQIWNSLTAAWWLCLCGSCVHYLLCLLQMVPFVPLYPNWSVKKDIRSCSRPILWVQACVSDCTGQPAQIQVVWVQPDLELFEKSRTRREGASWYSDTHRRIFDCPIFPLYFILAVQNMLSGPLSMRKLKEHARPMPTLNLPFHPAAEQLLTVAEKSCMHERILPFHRYLMQPSEQWSIVLRRQAMSTRGLQKYMQQPSGQDVSRGWCF
jgi:hypothetical protein